MAISVKRRGMMLVMSSASGAGKTTLSRQLLAADPEVVMSVSATTRPKRPSEEEGKDYFFVTTERFQEMVENGEFLEHARVFGHHYGTPRAPVEKALAEGRDVLFDIDWQGAQQLRQKARADMVGIFILPPSTEELEDRLKKRGQDSDEIVKRRMERAVEEISHWIEYDYVIINDDVAEALAEIRAIVTAERLRRERREGLLEFVASLKPNGGE